NPCMDKSTYSFFALGALSKPIDLCVPSQNGLLFDAPHRHSENDGLCSNGLPSASTNSTSPVTRSDPLSFTLMITLFSAVINMPPPQNFIGSISGCALPEN